MCPPGSRGFGEEQTRLNSEVTRQGLDGLETYLALALQDFRKHGSSDPRPARNLGLADAAEFDQTLKRFRSAEVGDGMVFVFVFVSFDQANQNFQVIPLFRRQIIAEIQRLGDLGRLLQLLVGAKGGAEGTGRSVSGRGAAVSPSA
jgi:hypothetical protein